MSNHPSCKKAKHKKPQGSYPARFIDVGSVGSPTAKIRETTEMNLREQRYITLSHCWGDSVPTRLLLENYNSRLNEFALDELPKTFQEAILVTRKLNVQFLWIDSMCIIQDSPDDWAAESAKMGFVYQNTHVNLAAAVSLNSNGGLFHQRYPLSFVPWTIPFPENTILQARYYDEKDNFILNTRGWILQEQVLVRRTLMFGNYELYWECHSGEASECRPGVFKNTTNMDHEATEKMQIRRTFSRLMELSKSEPLYDSERHKTWADLVSKYSARRLTKQSYKPVAISGLAERLSNGWHGITYLAGLWSHCLRRNLLWTCDNYQCGEARNNEVAPSWSWASLGTSCSLPRYFSTRRMDSLASVLEAAVTPLAQTHLFGQVNAGTVRIKGPLLRARHP